MAVRFDTMHFFEFLAFPFPSSSCLSKKPPHTTVYSYLIPVSDLSHMVLTKEPSLFRILRTNIVWTCCYLKTEMT